MILCVRVITTFLPYWSKNYLIEEIVVKIFGSCKTHPFYSERCNKAEENTCSTKYAKSSHIVGLRNNQHKKHIWNYHLSFFSLEHQISKSGNIISLYQFKQLKECRFWRLEGSNPSIRLGPRPHLLSSLSFKVCIRTGKA